MEFALTLVQTGISTSFDVAPIIAILVLFQVAVLRRRIPNLKRIVLSRRKPSSLITALGSIK